MTLACTVLLAGCGWTTRGGTTPPPPPPTATAPAARGTLAPPPYIDNASGSPRPWLASPVVAPALAQTPTPRVCPTPDPRNVATTPYSEGTCQQVLLFPAPAPTQVVAVAAGGAIEVQWATAGGGGTHYEVYRQVAPRGEWARLASVATDPDHEATSSAGQSTPYAWRDVTVTPGVTYRYTVAKVSAYGIRSTNSQASLPITAP